MASIVDVAAKAGVSVATVSRVLSNKPHVRPALRERVLAAVAQLDYQPSRVARSLRMQRSQVFGLIIGDIQNPFFTALARAVEDIAHSHEHAVFLCNTDENADKEQLYVALMEAEQVAGVIIAPTQEINSPCRWLVESGVPVVAIDRRLHDLKVDTVLVDNVHSAREVVRHLIEQGHQRIAVIAGPSATTTGRERLEGYVLAMEEAGRAINPAYIRQGLHTEEVGMRMAFELLDEPSPPDAIFAANNLLAAGVLAAMQSRNIRVPDELAIAAFGEVPWMRLVNPPMTVVRLPIYDMGAAAANLLIDRIHRRGTNAGEQPPPQEVVLRGQLLIRESSLRSVPTNGVAQPSS